MGLGGISMWQLLIVLLIVVVMFGTKKLRTIGGDLGGAVKSFRGAMADAESGTTEDKKLDEPDAEFAAQRTSESPERNNAS